MKNLFIIAALFAAYYWFKKRNVTATSADAGYLKSAWLLSSPRTFSSVTSSSSSSTPASSSSSSSGTVTTGSSSETGGQAGVPGEGEAAYFSNLRSISCFR